MIFGIPKAIFRLSIIFVQHFLSADIIENSKSHQSGTTTNTSHSRRLESSSAEISSATLKNLLNLL